MAQLERTYIIPLRKQVNKSPMYKRAKKAVNTVRAFLEKHMKSDDVRIGNKINLALWERGIRNPPGKIKVTVTKDDKGVVKAELFGHAYVEKKKVVKQEKSKLEQLKEKIAGKQGAETPEAHNKEAITHIPEHDHKTHGHTTKDHEREFEAEDEKERKVSSGKEKSGHRQKQ
jgi:large subunit ribosomal protein L31e